MSQPFDRERESEGTEGPADPPIAMPGAEKQKDQSVSDEGLPPLGDDEDDEHDEDFGDEHTPGPSDPPNAEAETPGGEDDGYQPQTRI